MQGLAGRMLALGVAVWLAGWAGAAGAFSGDGSGSAGDPYVITSVEQLQEMSDDLGAHYVLAHDIDASGTETWNEGDGFLPIGDGANRFTGSLDGNGYDVTGLFILGYDNYNALFAALDAGAVVENLGLVGATVMGNQNVGALAGYNRGTIRNCHASGIVDATSHTVGGLVGFNDGEISDSHTTTRVEAGGSTGGLIGFNRRAGLIERSWAAGAVQGQPDNVGGFVGTNEGTIRTSYAAGDVDARWGAGGFAHHNRGDIYDCFARGDVTADERVGGFAAEVWAVEDGFISRSYSSGRVSGTVEVGGFIGLNSGDLTVAGSFWDAQSSGQALSEGGTGLPTASMQQASTYTAAGWNFVVTWNIAEGASYPYLRSLPEPAGPAGSAAALVALLALARRRPSRRARETRRIHS
ncbi:MAG: GLUG motif-containing protein [Myxococcota bacterium]|nr:GLUG motif-containing protein [Myxococcota bacterium]